MSYQKIYRVVRRVPEGRVATYGQIAALAGIARHARQVGYALFALRDGDELDVPWHRVVNAKGEISARATGHEDLQRLLLESEGVVFDARGRIDLRAFGWQPSKGSGSGGRGRASKARR